jgi:hypothetical protein
MARPQLRTNQLITTFGPGAMLDLPFNSVIISCLEKWTYDPTQNNSVKEPRLSAKVGRLLRRTSVELRTPPPTSENYFAPGQVTPGVGAAIFPHWFIVQRTEMSPQKHRRRRLVYRDQLTERGKFKDGDRNWPVVPVRFVRACHRGHVGDLPWRDFVHNASSSCRRDLWIEDRGTTGDLSDIWVVCDCGAQRCMRDAAKESALGNCNGSRPWFDDHDPEGCKEANRLLIRTASNSYFPQVISVISIPDSMSKAEELVLEMWEGMLCNVESPEQLAQLRKMVPAIDSKLGEISNEDVFTAIFAIRSGSSVAVVRPVKEVEFRKLVSSAEESANDDPRGDFFARKLDKEKWQHANLAGLESVVLVQRLREVAALIGFTRFDFPSAEIDGELEIDVQRAPISLDAKWVPVTENRGEGVFLKFNPDAVESWLASKGVQERSAHLEDSFARWKRQYPNSHATYPGPAYIFLHSLSHLLISAISLDCGYPLSSLRERIYAPVVGNAEMEHCYGILIFTSSSGAEGTLGGLTQAARSIRKHLLRAIGSGTLCSNDPVCSAAAVREDATDRVAGSACHGCLFISETSCEQMNQFLDRALVVPTIDCKSAAFFKP